MRRTFLLNQNWRFTDYNGQTSAVHLPHTWNNIDGQDGGNDYQRGSCTYETSFPLPEYNAGEEQIYLEFDGVNASATVTVNGTEVCRHDGGYSTFRVNVTDYLRAHNTLVVQADNGVNNTVYPQKADFTFYGGIYRDVRLLLVNKEHFDLDYFGGSGLQVTAVPDKSYRTAKVQIKTWHNAADAQVEVTLLDAQGHIAAQGTGTELSLNLEEVRLWDGVKQPYLYTCRARLIRKGSLLDEVSARFGVRDFKIEPRKGFFLNGRSYPLHGVSRHQDRKGLGNAITRAMHDEDMALIREMGCNTVRLAHYQHDQHFYDLCDEAGMVVWAEIPYISEHMPDGRENTISQMKELIIQNYNHPSICVWGISNEITISTKDKKDMLHNHHLLNSLCHEMDPTRLTTLACYAMCGPFNKVAHITDVVSWNLYLGWYVPGLFLNDLWVKLFHMVYPHRALGFSEYGAEAMPNLHSAKPKRGDHTEEYQCIYHEYMLKFFERDGRMWATHVWNMFDFAADARDQGGEPGMNHKGLVTFDRTLRKDSFYLYKAWWSDEPFVHICGKRRADREEAVTTVKVYSNQPRIALYVNGSLSAEKEGEKIFTFQLPLSGTVRVEARSGSLSDTAVFTKTSAPNPAYRLQKNRSKSSNWV